MSEEDETFHKVSKIEFESDSEDDQIYRRTLTKKNEVNKGNVLDHPLAGHFNKALLQNHLDGIHFIFIRNLTFDLGK